MGVESTVDAGRMVAAIHDGIVLSGWCQCPLLPVHGGLPLQLQNCVVPFSPVSILLHENISDRI